MTNSDIGYIIINFSLIVVFCYFLFLLVTEIENFKNFKYILATFNLDDQIIKKNLLYDRYNSVYNNNNPYYLSKSWYIEKNIN